MIKPHESWFQYAADDLAFARAGFKEGFYAHVCFLCQQAIEKAMKGYLVAQDKNYPKSHGLVGLCRLLNVDWLDGQLSKLKKLSEYYVPLRYPDVAAVVWADGPPRQEEAETALRWATDIVALIESKLSSLS